LTAMRLLALAAAALALLSVACGGGSSTLSDSGPVLGKIPWSSAETAKYRVLRDDKPIGSAELRIGPAATAGASPGATTFSQEFDFPDDKIKDLASATATATALQPLAVSRTIDAPKGKRTCDTRYAGG